MYLLDTNVISAIAPTKAVEASSLAQWIRERGDIIFLSVVTASEITRGVAKLEREGANRKAELLRQWWKRIEDFYADRILPVDLRVAHAAGLILDYARAHNPGYEDIAVAATARVHGLTVLTRNERHFAPLGVTQHNPFTSLPN